MHLPKAERWLARARKLNPSASTKRFRKKFSTSTSDQRQHRPRPSITVSTLQHCGNIDKLLICRRWVSSRFLFFSGNDAGFENDRKTKIKIILRRHHALLQLRDIWEWKRRSITSLLNCKWRAGRHWNCRGSVSWPGHRSSWIAQRTRFSPAQHTATTQGFV